MTCCPTCGAALSGQFSWSPEERMFRAPDGAAKFTRVEAQIFDVLWRARNLGSINDQERFMAAVYGERANGGPETFGTLSVHLIHMRARMIGTGYTITMNVGRPRQGWRVVKLERAVA